MGFLDALSNLKSNIDDGVTQTSNSMSTIPNDFTNYAYQKGFVPSVIRGLAQGSLESMAAVNGIVPIIDKQKLNNVLTNLEQRGEADSQANVTPDRQAQIDALKQNVANSSGLGFIPAVGAKVLDTLTTPSEWTTQGIASQFNPINALTMLAGGAGGAAAKTALGAIAKGAALGAAENAAIGGVSGGLEALGRDKSADEAWQDAKTGAVGGALMGGVLGGFGGAIGRNIAKDEVTPSTDSENFNVEANYKKPDDNAALPDTTPTISDSELSDIIFNKDNNENVDTGVKQNVLTDIEHPNITPDELKSISDLHDSVTPQLKEDAADFSVNTDDTPPNNTVRGKIAFGGDEQKEAVISLFKDADSSTLLHEMAHYYRQNLSPELEAHANEVFGVKDGKWSYDNEEAFSNGFVKYLSDGNAPTPEVKGIFSQFRDFLTKLFNTYVSADSSHVLTPAQKVFYNALVGDAKSAKILDEAYNGSAQKGKIAQLFDNPALTNIHADILSEYLNFAKDYTPVKNQTAPQKIADIKEEFANKIGADYSEDDYNSAIKNAFSKADAPVFEPTLTPSGAQRILESKGTYADWKKVTSDLIDYNNLKSTYDDGSGVLFQSAKDANKAPRQSSADGEVLAPKSDNLSGELKNNNTTKDIKSQELYQAAAKKQDDDIKSAIQNPIDHLRNTFVEPANVLEKQVQKVGWFLRGLDAKGAPKDIENKTIRYVRDKLVVYGGKSDKDLDGFTMFKLESAQGYIQAEKVATELSSKLNDVSAKDLHLALDGDADIASLHPDLQPIAQTMRNIIDSNANDIAQLGGLKKEDLIKDYTKRIYDADIKEAKSVQSAIFGGRTDKERGKVVETRTIKIPEGVNAPKVGDTFFKSNMRFEIQKVDVVGDAATITYKRDYNAMERGLKGQIQDARFTIAYTIAKQNEQKVKYKLLQQFVGNAREFENDEAAAKIGYAQMPNDRQLYGVLAGKYIPEHLKNDLDIYLSISKASGELQGVSNALSLVRYVVSVKKGVDTYKNPVTHLGNFISNILTTALDTPYAFRFVGHKGYFEEAKSFGLFDSKEINDFESISKHIGIDLKKSDAQNANAMFTFAKNLVLAKDTTASEFVKNLYANEDNIFKAAYYGYYKEQALAKGADVTAASAYALRQTIERTLDFTKPMPVIMRTLDRYGILPFVQFSLRSMPTLVRNMARNPVKTALFIAAGNYLFNTTDAEEAAKPVWMRGSHNMLFIPDYIKLPWSDNHKPQFINVGRFIPGWRWNPVNLITHYSDYTGSNAKMFDSLGYLGALINIIQAKDARTGNDFATKEDGMPTTYLKQAYALATEAFPNYLLRNPAKMVEAFSNDKVDKLSGMEVNTSDVALSTLIGKTQTINMDLAKQHAYNHGLNNIKDKAFNALLNGGNIDDARDAANKELKNINALLGTHVALTDDGLKQILSDRLQTHYESLERSYEKGELTEDMAKAKLHALQKAYKKLSQ